MKIIKNFVLFFSTIIFTSLLIIIFFNIFQVNNSSGAWALITFFLTTLISFVCLLTSYFVDKPLSKKISMYIFIFFIIILISLLSILLSFIIKYPNKYNFLNFIDNDILNYSLLSLFILFLTLDASLYAYWFFKKYAPNENTKKENKKLKSSKNKKSQKNNKKNNYDINSIKEDAILIKNNLNNNMKKVNEDNFLEPEVIVSAVPKMPKNKNISNENTPKENYEELLEELKNTKSEPQKIVKNKSPEENITQSEEINDKNIFINEQIDKIEIFLPRTNRNNNIDIQKLKEDIFYENRKRNNVDINKSNELQQKYSSEVVVGDSDNIWELTKQKKKADKLLSPKNINNNPKVNSNIKSNDLKDYLNYKETKD